MFGGLDTKRFSVTAGSVLRGARRAAGLSIREVAVRSGGRFKASVLGGYERGERAISLVRFWELAGIYGVPADRLLGFILGSLSPEGRTEIVIDLTRLAHVSGLEGRMLAEFVHQVRSKRADYQAEVITLRSGDLEQMSLASHQTPISLLRKLRPALRSSDEPYP